MVTSKKKAIFFTAQYTQNLKSHTELYDGGIGSRSDVGDENESGPELVPNFTQASAAY
jgi:hypothetical protein